MNGESEVRDRLDVIFRAEGDRVLATLVRLLGDIELAEEARAEAFASALKQWPAAGLPDNPRAWLVNVGRNQVIDRLRRAATFRARITPLELASADAPIVPGDGDEDGDEHFGDDRLRLIFTCCHPGLSLEAQVALTLRVICGLGSEAVARAFLISEETLAQRLVRAKKKIREAGIPYETPPPALLDARVDGVLAVLYLVFSEGYALTTGGQLLSRELCSEAIRLARLLDALLPGRSAVQGLLALMLLHDARAASRIDARGDIVLLEAQDRSLWDRAQIDAGLALVERALGAKGRVSPYAVQAAIAALHARADTGTITDWPQIAGLYEVLLRLAPTPVIELNHAVAVAMVDGPARALDLADSLAARGFSDYHLLAAVRADLLRRLGRRDEAAVAYREALQGARLAPERRLLERRLAQLAARN